MKHHKPTTLLIGTLALLTSVLVAAPPAQAASASACVSSPSAANCDGLDAATEDWKPNGGASCFSGAFQIVDDVFPFVPRFDSPPGGGAPAGVQVQLWWSPRCQTNWTRIVSTGYEGRAWIDVRRIGDGSSVRGEWVNEPYGLTRTGYTSAWISAMVYAPGPVEACAGDHASWGGCRSQQS